MKSIKKGVDKEPTRTVGPVCHYPPLRQGSDAEWSYLASVLPVRELQLEQPISKPLNKNNRRTLPLSSMPRLVAKRSHLVLSSEQIQEYLNQSISIWRIRILTGSAIEKGELYLAFLFDFSSTQLNLCRQQ